MCEQNTGVLLYRCRKCNKEIKHMPIEHDRGDKLLKILEPEAYNDGKYLYKYLTHACGDGCYGVADLIGIVLNDYKGSDVGTSEVMRCNV